MEFKVDGKKIKPTVGYDVIKIKKFLDKLPDGEFLSANGLAEKLNLSPGYMREILKLKLPGYYLEINHKTFFGNVKTVKAFQEQI